MSSPDHDSFRTLLAMAGNCSNLDELKLFCRMLLGPPAPSESVMDLTTTSISTSPSEHTSHSNGQIEGQRYDPSSEPYSTHYGAYGEQRYDPSSEPYPMHYVPCEGRRHDTSLDTYATNEVPKVFKTEKEYTRKILPGYAIIIGIGSKSLKNRNLGATSFYHSIRNRYTPLEVVYYKLLREFEKQQRSTPGCIFPISEEHLLFVTVDHDGEKFYPILEDRDSTVLSDIKDNGKKDVKPTLNEYAEHLFIHIQIKKRTLQTLHDNDDCVMIVQNVLKSIEEAISNGIPDEQALDKHKTLIKETWNLYFPEHNMIIKPKKKQKRKNHDKDGDGQSNNDANAGDDGGSGGFHDQFNTDGENPWEFHELGGGQTYGGVTGYASLQNHLHTCKENDSSHDSDENSTDDSLPRWKHGSSDSDESEDEESDGDDDDDDDNENGMPKIESGKSGPCSKSSPMETMSKADDQDSLYTCRKSLETMDLNLSDEIETTKSFGFKPDEESHQSTQEHNEDDGGGMPMIVLEKTLPGTMSSPIEPLSNADDLVLDTCQESLEMMHLDPSDEIESKKRCGSKPVPQQSQREQEEAKKKSRKKSISDEEVKKATDDATTPPTSESIDNSTPTTSASTEDSTPTTSASTEDSTQCLIHERLDRTNLEVGVNEIGIHGNTIVEIGKETNAKATGKTCTVPKWDVNKLAYFLYCGTIACGVDIIQDELVDYQNVHKLPSDRQDAIFLLAYHTFDLDTLRNKTIFYDASNEMIPRGRINEFYSLESVDPVLAVQESVMIGGQQTQVRKIMVFNKKWLTDNYIDPLKRNESRIRRIVAAMEQEKANTLTVEEALTGLLQLLTTNESNQSKHCDHCQGSEGVCDCENGCPAKVGSQCQVVHKTITCDLCMTQGIKGTRYQCKECFNFDLCDYCYEHGDHAMGTHAFSRMPRVGSTPVYVQPKRTLTASASTNVLPTPVVTPDDNRTKYDRDIPIALAVESPNFRPDQTVRITGLVSKPEWNGRTASVKRDMGDGRVVVIFLDDGKNMTVKAANLEVVNEIDIPVNTIVEIFGVAMDVTLNGELGVVVNVSNANRPDRVQVQLLNNDSRVLSLKPENLRIVEDVAS